jgi:hypothetical protein
MQSFAESSINQSSVLSQQLQNSRTYYPKYPHHMDPVTQIVGGDSVYGNMNAKKKKTESSSQGQLRKSSGISSVNESAAFNYQMLGNVNSSVFHNNKRRPAAEGDYKSPLRTGGVPRGS